MDTATDRLTRRVEVAKSRAAARAERADNVAFDAGSNGLGLIKKHPFATIGGAIVVGALAAQLLPGRIGKGSRKKSRRAFDLAAGAAELALAYAKRASENAVDTSRESAIKLGHAGHEFGAMASDRLNGLASELGNRLGDSSDGARKVGRELAGSASDKARDASALAARKLRELAAKIES